VSGKWVIKNIILFTIKLCYSASETAANLGLNYTDEYGDNIGIFFSDLFNVRLVGGALYYLLNSEK
jgi:hypothetical protein